MVNVLALAHGLDLIGKIMVSYTAIAVHHRVWKEHKIDDAVFTSMRREQFVGIIGILLMVISFVFEISTVL